MTNWQLPSHINDHLAPETHWIEGKRRALLDMFFAHGFRLIMPPLAEYQEALALGGYDLDRRMLKVVDALSGRMMGLRPDITPQSARIDAHVLAEDGVTRLCYADRVMHAYPATPFAQREPLHIGAEVYGEESWLADAEVIQLLHQALVRCGIEEHHIELHHMGLIRDLAEVSGLTQHPQWSLMEEEYLQALQRKDQSALQSLFERAQISNAWLEKCKSFVGIFGGIEVLSDAEALFSESPVLLSHLQAMRDLAEHLAQKDSSLTISFDLSDGQGYHYHTGLIFSVYAPSWSQALAQGGRYDGFGARFGRSRPATGFSLDLDEVWGCLRKKYEDSLPEVLAGLPYQSRIFVDEALSEMLSEKIQALRAAGVAVVIGVVPNGSTPLVEAKRQACHEWLEGREGKRILVE